MRTDDPSLSLAYHHTKPSRDFTCDRNGRWWVRTLQRFKDPRGLSYHRMGPWRQATARELREVGDPTTGKPVKRMARVDPEAVRRANREPERVAVFRALAVEYGQADDGSWWTRCERRDKGRVTWGLWSACAEPLEGLMLGEIVGVEIRKAVLTR